MCSIRAPVVAESISAKKFNIRSRLAYTFVIQWKMLSESDRQHENDDATDDSLRNTNNVSIKVRVYVMDFNISEEICQSTDGWVIIDSIVQVFFIRILHNMPIHTSDTFRKRQEKETRKKTEKSHKNWN